jgi:hypothetical protein
MREHEWSFFEHTDPTTFVTRWTLSCRSCRSLATASASVNRDREPGLPADIRRILEKNVRKDFPADCDRARLDNLLRYVHES